MTDRHGDIVQQYGYTAFGDEKYKNNTSAFSVTNRYTSQQVDEDTGQIDLIRIVAAQDVGKAINPLNCEGQIEGAVAMGVGAALMESLIYEQGCLQNADWSTYKIPTILDVPPIKSLIVEAPHPDGPFGAKGVGEPGVAPTPPSIASAVFDATGVRIFDLPLTPEKIYWALKKKSKKEK